LRRDVKASSVPSPRKSFTARYAPNAAATPIAGAPRTTSRLMASCICLSSVIST
jgi:hypothetical protein